ncbi:hypothetical protein BH11BAC4_BH11BAC4_16130 [soil metagenome]
MATNSLHHNYAENYPASLSKTSFITRFLSWCNAQENDRLFWVGFALVSHGCIITPLTIIAIMFTGAGVAIIPFGIAMLSMVMVLVTNLAALPTKYTIPFFVLSIMADLAIIATVLL